ncbi:hypothetical protein EZ456_04105 [Pedobacter psychrodurus]|uniref:HipA-like kinase domain-containing protein n=1 Tax=Pedobacter psychrodurus TaxID=2530456 RepID=A0A4R0PZB8_9SPHI|nr:HipA family kinase [Pedobacter psychrodurus]TCD28581.1 hypothetical protein EZ456_04105 [Pedobacter psychrodurus]
MLKVYKALSFQGVVKGSKTAPWLVLVNADGEVKPYVIKLFDREKHFEGDALSREVMGNVLAGQFGLDVPHCALIDINGSSFESSILNGKALERFNSLQIKIAFGTEYLYPHFCFFDGILHSRAVMDNIKIPSLFAFDIMIRNTDRSFKRPNLLIHSGLTYLIDFESSFQFRKDPLGDVLIRTKTHTYYYMHVFHRLLKDLDIDKKSIVFDDFIMKLGATEFSFLSPYLNQLTGFGFVIQEYHQAVDYLEAIKQNRFRFDTALKSLLDE